MQQPEFTTPELLAANAALLAEIAERKRIEAQLNETQRRLERSLKGANLGTWTYRVATDDFWADDRALTLHGHAPGEAKTFVEAGMNIHPDDYEQSQAIFTAALQTRSNLQMEYRVIWRNGSIHWIASYAELDPVDGGTFYGIVQDITEAKRREIERLQTETALRETEARLRVLIQNLPGGAVFVVDRDLRYLLAEGEALSIAGFKPEDLVGRTIFEAMPPELIPHHERLYRRGLSGEPFEHEHHAHDRDYVSRGTPLRSQNGEVYAVIAVSYDITDRKQTEANLCESEEKYRSLFESIDRGFCLIEVLFDAADRPFDYRFIEVNPVFEQQSGLADAVGKTILELVPNLEPQWIEFYGQVAKSGEAVRFEADVTSMNRVFDIYAFPSGALGQHLVAVLFADISERVRVEDDRKRAELQLHRAAEIDAFWVKLSDALRSLSDPVQIQAQACRLLGEQLGVDRAYYVEVHEAEGYARVNQHYSRGDSPSIVGNYRLSEYGWSLPIMRRGETIVITDTQSTDIIPDAERAAMARISMVGFVAVPLIKGEVLVGSLAVNEPTPREWTEAEVELVRETAERIWADIQRAHAEIALRQSEAKYRSLFTSIDEGFTLLEMIFDELGHPADFRIVETNPAWEQQTELTDAVGKTLLEISPNFEQQWIDFYSDVVVSGRGRRIEYYTASVDRWYSVYASRIGGEESRQLAVVFNDISDRKRLEEERKQTEAANTADFIDSLSSGGEMGKVVRSMDWSKTPLGPIESWTQSLRTTVSLCLASNFPINIIWGPGRVQIYNDGYRLICGDKHPHSMGQDLKECWLSAWDVIGEPYERATAGETTFLENQRIFLNRNSYLEETFFTFSFSPIREETGGVGGVFHPVTEITQQTLAERRLKVLRDLAERTVNAKTLEEACDLIAQALAAHELDLPFTLLYRLDPDGKADLVGMTGLEPGSAVCPRVVDLEVSPEWSLAEVTRSAMADQRSSGQIRQVNHLERRFGAFECSPYPETPQSAIVMPIALPGLAHPWGVFVAGVSPRRALDEAYQTFYTLLSKSVTTVITNAHAYEEERKRAEALAEIDRAKTTFFSNVSHEFRTPLTLSLAPLQDALSDHTHPLAPVTRERLELVHRNSLRLLKLVNTLLDFSRIEAGRMEAVYEPTDLATYTAELSSVFRSAIERAGLQLMVDCPPLPEPVFVDRGMWEKIVLNLLSNAFKFTFEGAITVRLRSADGNQAILQIQDTGTGIAPKHLPHLFERFYQVRGTQARTHEGSGIGLALVHELVRLQGGTIEVSSLLAEGTCFTVSLPFGAEHLPSDRTLASTAIGATAYMEEAERWLPTQDNQELTIKDAKEQTTQSADSSLPTNTSAHVLVVDDNADMREYLTRILNQHVQVEAVTDGATALAVAQERIPDLILSDVMMPGLDGFELLQALRADPRTREIPIILLSARAGEEAIVEGLEAGADDYLIKPFSAQELISRVTAHLQMAQLRGEALQEARSTLHSRDEFISVVSHELNTPLVSILGWTRLLRSSPPNPVMLSKALDTIERNATLQAKLVQDLLDFSRISSGKLRLNPQPIELQPVIETAIATVAQTATDKSINLTLQETITEPVVVMGDSDRLSQVLINLLTNAIKFTPESGSVRVELSVMSDDGSTDTSDAEIRVVDTGIGIAADFLPHMFDHFSQAQDANAAKGLGLGLAIARHIVELHNGTIYADSAGEGQGATFTVRLPLLPATIRALNFDTCQL